MEVTIPIAFKVLDKSEPMKITEEQKEKYYGEKPVPPHTLLLETTIGTYTFDADLVNEPKSYYNWKDGLCFKPEAVVWLYMNDKVIYTGRGMNAMDYNQFTSFITGLIKKELECR